MPPLTWLAFLPALIPYGLACWQLGRWQALRDEPAWVAEVAAEPEPPDPDEWWRE